MKCSACDGKGYFPISDIAAKVCECCNGTGEIVMNNKEFLRSCNDEELPKALKEMYLYIKDKMRIDIGSYNKLMNGDDYFKEWLNSPHEEK